MQRIPNDAALFARKKASGRRNNDYDATNRGGAYAFDHRSLTACAALLAAALAVAPAAAAGYPDHPVKVIVPFAAGGPTDVMARLIAQKISENLKQQFFVENHPGAGGNIGMTIVARANPDGYTILVASSSFVVNPSLYANNPYDAFKDSNRSRSPRPRRISWW